MSATGRMKFQASLQQASTALEHLMRELAPFGTPDDRDAVELGASEILSNIVRHGYQGSAGPIRIRWSAQPARIQLCVCDTGRPIPQRSFEDAASTVFDFENTSIGDLPEGGLGLALAQRSFHEMRYRSRAGVNRLVAVRRIG